MGKPGSFLWFPTFSKEKNLAKKLAKLLTK